MLKEKTKILVITNEFGCRRVVVLLWPCASQRSASAYAANRNRDFLLFHIHLTEFTVTHNQHFWVLCYFCDALIKDPWKK